MTEINETNSDSTFEGVYLFGRVIALCIGITLILIGLFYSLKIFNAVHMGIMDPQKLEPIISQWTEIFDKETEIIVGAKLSLNLGKIIAMGILGGGSIVLTIIALSILSGGIKIILWSSGEREAIKKILSYTFGKAPHNFRSAKK